MIVRAVFIVLLVLAVLSCSKQSAQSNGDIPRISHNPNFLAKSLNNAINDGQLEQVKAWIAKGAGSDARANLVVNPLHVAIQADEPQIFQFLLDSGLDIDAHGEYGFTPLIYAVTLSNKVICRILLDNGADVDVASIPTHQIVSFTGANPVGVTPLYAAACLGEEQIFEMFLVAGADVSIADEYGVTPLHMASGNDLLFDLLLKNGADPKAKTNLGYIPVDYALRFAIAESDLEDVVHHLSEGANPDICTTYYNQGCVLRVPWRTAAILEVLLESGMNPNKLGGVSYNPLHAACKWGDLKAVQLLLDNGANPKAVDESGRTALFAFLFYSDQAAYEIVELLIEAGCRVDTEDKWGETPLSQATDLMNSGWADYAEIIELMQQSLE